MNERIAEPTPSNFFLL